MKSMDREGFMLVVKQMLELTNAGYKRVSYKTS